MVRWDTSWRLLTPLLCVVLAGCSRPPNPIDLSSDGRRVVTNIGPQPGLQILEADGSGTRALPGTEGAQGPRWSRDERRIAFATPDGVAIYDVEKQAVSHLIQQGKAVGAWSPAGDALAAFRTTEDGLEACWFRLPEFREVGHVAIPTGEIDESQGAVWLEKRHGIAFMGHTSSGPDELYTIEDDVVYRITNTRDVIGFGLDADGDHLLWAREAPAMDSGVTFWKYDLRTRSVVRQPFAARITPTAAQRRQKVSPVAWVRVSPDARYVALGTGDGTGGGAVSLARLDGAGLRLLERIPAPDPRSKKPEPEWGFLSTRWAAGSERLAVVKLGIGATVNVYDVAGGPAHKLRLAAPPTKE